MRHTCAYDDEEADEVRGQRQGRVGQSEKSPRSLVWT